MQYPQYDSDDCTELIHDFQISDPFRWLEDPYSDRTKKFVQEQNLLTENFLKKSKLKDKIIRRTIDSWDFEKFSSLRIKKNRFFYDYNNGLQNQYVLYYADGATGLPKVLIDPNELDKNGTVALRYVSISKDASIVAYMLSTAGSDWSEIHNISTGEKYNDILKHVKYSCLEWSHDNKGVFYNWYPERKSADDGTETNCDSNQKLRYHCLGTDQKADPICIEFLENPSYKLHLEISHCGRYGIVNIFKSCDPKCALHFVDFKLIDYNIKGPLKLVPLYDQFDASYEYITNEENMFYFMTDLEAPMMRIISFKLDMHEKQYWKDIISHDSKIIISNAIAIKDGKLVVNRLIDVIVSLSNINLFIFKSHITMHDLKDGKMLRKFDLPYLGTVCALSGSPNEDFFSFQFTSYLYPTSLYMCQVDNPENKPRIFRETKMPKGLELSRFQSKQVFYESKDGTKIPMFIIQHKDAPTDGSAVCQLYGYGGFNIPLLPVFSIKILVFLELFHGIFACANIRGGSEYGENWYHQGRLDKKQNCFDDFIAAAEYLIDKKYTKTDKLFIRGGSNGGLLVVACANQRPDLFGAVIPEVPVMDLLRFHKFTIGYMWISDYGDPEKSECFKYIYKISPLHNIKKGVAYPAMMILTADHDDRVVPLHSFKFMATLQSSINLEQQKQPLLLRIECNSGHGAGTPTNKQINELADILAFVQLCLDVPCFFNESSE